MKDSICALLFLLGFIIMLGAVGGADCGTMTLGEMAKSAIVGVLLMGAGEAVGVATTNPYCRKEKEKAPRSGKTEGAQEINTSKG